MHRRAFTLIELLVVIAIIAILAAILFPVFAQAKVAAKKAVSLSNARQIGMAVQMYVMDNGAYPQMSSPSSWNPRVRWPDRIHAYVKNEDIFLAPNADQRIFAKTWAHNPEKKYGGYGYNYQYLGNSRTSANGLLPFTASEGEIGYTAETIVIADTNGVRRDDNSVSAGEYTVDPPVVSSRGSGKPSGFYGEGAECGSGNPGPGVWGCRATPAERHSLFCVVAFADGHAKAMKLSRLDDHDGNGQRDNGFWNGQADATVR